LKEYTYCLIFIIIFSLLLFCSVERKFGEFWTTGAFMAGAFTSIIAGWIGMVVAVYANARVALKCKKSL